MNFSQRVCCKKKDISSCLESVEISQLFLSRIVGCLDQILRREDTPTDLHALKKPSLYRVK